MSEQNEQANLDKIEMSFITKTRLQADSSLEGEAEEWITSEFLVDEYMSRPYFGTVNIGSSEKNIDYSKLLGKSCTLIVSRGPGRVRKFHGIVYRVELLGTHMNESAAKVQFAPALYALDHGQNSRIFEDMTAPMIIEQVLKEGLAPFERQVKLQITEKYANREYCVQYKESDLNFISRLMIDEGLLLYFEQNSENETIVIVDNNYAFVEVDTMGEKKAIESTIEQGLDDWATAGQTASDASNFVEIQLVDEDGEPMANAPYVIKLPNGSKLDYQLNGDGWANVPIAKYPQCRVSFIDPEATEKKAD